MKTYTLIASALLLLTLGCASSQYVVTSKSGKQYVTKHKPDLDKKTDTYTFKDQTGSEWTLNQGEVESIEKKKK